MRRLPSLPRWLAGLGLPAHEREFMTGDLEEEYARRGGGIAAHWWLWRQAIALVFSRVWRGSRRAAGLIGREGMLQDIRFALRVLAKDRAFTCAVLLTLALCIGANTTMLSIVRSVVLKPLPFPGSDRLVLVYNGYPNANNPRSGASAPDYFDRRSAIAAFEHVAIYQNDQRRLGDDQGVERVASLRATPSLLQMIGARAVQGRLLTDADAQPGKDFWVMISHALWQRKFGGEPVIDHVVRLNEVPYRIVGVLPPDFSFLTNQIDIVEPRAFSDAERADSRRHSNEFQMVALLRPGATIAMAQDQINALNASLADRFPAARQRLQDIGYHSVVVSLNDDVVAGVKRMLYLLWGGVAFVLLIGCVNIANLVVIRATSRTREMATRHAIGADFAQLSRQLVVESAVLCAAGGALGILLGAWALRSVQSFYLDQLPRGYEVGIDVTSVAAIMLATLVIGVALGLLPVARLRRMNLNTELREDTRGGTAGRRARAARSAMATAQLAIAFVVLVGAGLLFASFQAEMRLTLGFEPAGVSTVTVELPRQYRTVPLEIQYVQRTLETLRAMPEVSSAAAGPFVPFSQRTDSGAVAAEAQSRVTRPSNMRVTPGFFQTLGIQVVAGRDFEPGDTAGAPHVAMVDERVAQAFWPGQNPVGRRLYRPVDPRNPAITPDTQLLTVVGVVNAVRVIDPRSDPAPAGVVFVPYDQLPSTTITFLTKSRTGANLTGRMREVMAATDRSVPTYRPRTMDEWVGQTFQGRRAPMTIAVMFACAAWLLSAIGVYGVVAHGVSQRRREFGVRLALGETTTGIFRLVLVSGAQIIGAGLAIGLAGAFFVGQAMRSELYNVAPTSPSVLLATALGLSAVAIVASVVPAWRASRIDPVTVLSR